MEKTVINVKKLNSMESSISQKAAYQINMNDAVSAKESDWVQACIDAAKNNDYYRTFRSSVAFQRVIEGTPIVGGIWNLKRLLRRDKFLRALPLIQLSDTVGLPLNMIDFIAPSSGEKNVPTTYSLSPTTIRYANNALNCSALFGDTIFNGEVEVCEIGSGYGGECKAFNDFAVTLSGSRLGEKWHIYDLPSSRGIIERFLSHFHYSASFDELNSSSKNSNDTLVISNGAFSEMTGSLLDAYFDSVIATAKFGYFITNFEIHSAPHGGWTTAEFIKRLRTCGKTDVAILPTAEYLSYFDQQAKSSLIVFGHTGARKDSTTFSDIVKIRLISIMREALGAFQRFFMRH
ncbi:MAG: hypothetical protein WAV46_03740 [Candidatus Moraniibacteriota bacterium]